MDVSEVKILVILLVGFQLKHFICDFPLQNIFGNYMINNKGSAKFSEWFSALLLHGTIHSAGTAITVCLVLAAFLEGQINLFTKAMIFYILIAEIVLHLIIDRVKASKNLGGRWTPDNKKFWWALGLDQMSHQICYIAFSAMLVFSLTYTGW